MTTFDSATNALNNKEYYQNINSKIDNILGASEAIKVDEVINSIFSNLDMYLNKNGKNILNKIASMDGDNKTFNRQELITLLCLLDAKTTEDSELEYDGIISLDKKNKLNEINCNVIDWFFRLIKNHDDIKNNKNTELNIDKKLGNTYQVQLNCWFLSELNGYDKTDFGHKIITNAIQINEDGTYTVEFKGDNKVYTFTKEDLLNAKSDFKHVVGNDTVLLLEVAFERLFAELETEREINYGWDKEFSWDENGNCNIQYGYKTLSVTADDLKDIDNKNETEVLKVALIKNKLEEGMHGSFGFTEEFDILYHLSGTPYMQNLQIDDENNYCINSSDDILKAKKAVKENLKLYSKKIEEALVLQAKNSKDMTIVFNCSYSITPEKVQKYPDGGHAYYIKDVKLNSKGTIKKVGIVNPHNDNETIYKSFKHLLKISVDHGYAPYEDGFEPTSYTYSFATDNDSIKKALNIEEE